MTTTTVLDRFDIEQDSSGLAIKREVIKQIGDIDVELVADRNNSGETYRALRCPLHHASGNSARLRDQRQISRTRHVRGETCIEVGTGHHDAKTIWSYQPHSIFLRGALGSLRQRSGAVAKARGDNERARRAPFSCLVDDVGDRGGRRRNCHKFGHKLQFVETTDGADAVDLGIVGIHQPKIHL